MATLTTRGGVRRTDDGSHVRDSSPSFLRHALEQTLRSLGVDHVDILLVHWPDAETPVEETAGCVAEFVSEGKVRVTGVSNFDTTQMASFAGTAPIHVLQPPYSLLRRGIDDQVLPYGQQHGIGTFVYGVLAHGLLSGKYDRETTIPRDDWRSTSPVFKGEVYERNVAVAERLRTYAEQTLGMSLAELAAAWTLHRPGVDCAIVGGRSLEQIRVAANMSEIRLDPDQLKTVEDIAAAGLPVGGPAPENSVPR